MGSWHSSAQKTGWNIHTLEGSCHHPHFGVAAYQRCQFKINLFQSNQGSFGFQVNTVSIKLKHKKDVYKPKYLAPTFKRDMWSVYSYMISSFASLIYIWHRQAPPKSGQVTRFVVHPGGVTFDVEDFSVGLVEERWRNIWSQKCQTCSTIHNKIRCHFKWCDSLFCEQAKVVDSCIPISTSNFITVWQSPK